MCQSLQTKQGQAWIPDFLKNTSGTSVEIKDRKNQTDVGTDLLPSDYDEFAIKRRKDDLRRQYGEHPGSVQPNLQNTKKKMLEDI